MRSTDSKGDQRIPKSNLCRKSISRGAERSKRKESGGLRGSFGGVPREAACARAYVVLVAQANKARDLNSQIRAIRGRNAEATRLSR